MSWKRTFFGLAVRGGQDGRQWILVVAIEYQNVPSAELSRAMTRVQRGSSSVAVGVAVSLDRSVRSWLGDGTYALVGLITPLDEAARAVPLSFVRPDWSGLNNLQRCADAVYRQVKRHAGPGR